VVENAYT